MGGGRGMKLGSKAKDVDQFVDQLKSEGESKWLEIYLFFKALSAEVNGQGVQKWNMSVDGCCKMLMLLHIVWITNPKIL